MEKVIGSQTCVYVTGFFHDHRDAVHSDPEATARHMIAGVSNTFLSNRVSWFYDFKGHSVTLDTACSSSMVGLHLAVQSLKAGESEMVRLLLTTSFERVSSAEISDRLLLAE
jgi:acyl transferase domain-containing protein